MILAVIRKTDELAKKINGTSRAGVICVVIRYRGWFGVFPMQYQGLRPAQKVRMVYRQFKGKITLPNLKEWGPKRGSKPENRRGSGKNVSERDMLDGP